MTDTPELKHPANPRRTALRPDPTAAPGDPPFRNLIYCQRCCMPETNEGNEFDEMGICKACRSSEQKMRIDWRARQRELEVIIAEAKAKSGNNYDCVVPISGGKDSTFQLHVLVNVFKVTPLCVTFSHNWFTETGKQNLLSMAEQEGTTVAV